MIPVQHARNRFWQRRIHIGLLVTWMALFFIAPGMAQQPSPVQMTASAGFDGYCKDFHWLPVKVALENNGPDLEGRLEARLPNLFGNDTTFAAPVSLPGPSRKEIILYIYPEAGFLNEFPLALIAGGKTVVQIQVSMDCSEADDRFFGILAADPSAFNILAELDPDPARAVLAPLEMAALPEQAAALQALDVIIVSGVDTGQLTPGQRQALAGWVASGGQLWVTGGADGRKTAAGLGELLPFKPDATTRVDRLNSLATFVDRLPELQGSAILAIGSTTEKAQVLVAEDELPLLISQPWGYGQVIYLAADPSQDPLRNWPGAEDFYRRLLEEAVAEPSFARGFQNWSYSASALGSLGNLRMPPAGLVLGLLAAYVLAVGPANYLLVRVLRRRELAWVTIPAVVLLFSGLAFALGIQGRGNRPVVQRLAIVQAFPGILQANVNALVGVFSPSRKTYQVKLGPNFLAHPIPENMALSAGGGWVFEQNGTFGTLLPDVRIEVGAMKAVALEGNILAPSIQSDLVLDLDSKTPALVGRLTNRSDVSFEDAVLISHIGQQRIGTLSPGQTVEVSLLSQGVDPGTTGKPEGEIIPPIRPEFGGPFAYNDPFLVNLLGTNNFYSDSETSRRFSLIAATIPFNQVSNENRSGFFLAGWTAEAPFETLLEGQPASFQDTTLYLIPLPFELSSPGNQLTISPGLFSWSSLDFNMGYFASPYNLTLQQSDYTFSYKLAIPVDFREVISLTLHLTGIGLSGPVGFDIYLWDVSLEQWVLVDSPAWGDNPISTPERYVSPDGEVRLWLDAGAQSEPVTLDAADFTLVVGQ